MDLTVIIFWRNLGIQFAPEWVLLVFSHVAVSRMKMVRATSNIINLITMPEKTRLKERLNIEYI